MTRGRKRALTDEEVHRARWMYANTSCSMERIALHLRVSQGVIQDVIDHKGAYQFKTAVKKVFGINMLRRES